MDKITFIGIGRLGLCSALIFDKYGYDVIGVDVSQDYVNKLNNKEYKTEEPFVEEYLINSKNFKATTSLKEGLDFSNDIFIVVPTPNGGGVNFYDHSILSNLLNKLNDMKIKNKNLIFLFYFLFITFIFFTIYFGDHLHKLFLC